MFIMDVPYVPTQDTHIVLVQAAAPSSVEPDYLMNFCKETTSIGNPMSAVRGVNPAGWLAAYIENHSQRLIDSATEAKIKITLLEGTSHGKLNPHTSGDGRLYYMYEPTPEYSGNDRAVFLAEFEGKRYKFVVDLHVFPEAAIPENVESTCPPHKLIKVNKPATGSSGYGSGYAMTWLLYPSAISPTPRSSGTPQQRGAP